MNGAAAISGGSGGAAGVRPCPLCAGTSSERLAAYSTPEWHVHRCRSCGFVFLLNPPPYDALAEEYAWERTSAEKRARGGSTRLSGPIRRLRAALGLRGASRADARFLGWFGPGRVLDVGCGDRVRTAPPIVPFGIEPSRALQARADALMRAQGGHCLLAPGAEGIESFDDAFFDGVILHSSLEHEAQPLRLLRGVARVLRPGARAYVRVPNFGSLNRRVVGANWCGFRHPDHVSYFTRRSLRAMAERAGLGFRLLNGARLLLDDNIHALLLKPARP